MHSVASKLNRMRAYLQNWKYAARNRSLSDIGYPCTHFLCKHSFTEILLKLQWQITYTR